MDENSLGLKCSFFITHVFATTTNTGLKIKFYSISNEYFDEPFKNRIQKKINNTFYCIKICYMPLKNNLCISLHFLLFINLSHFTIVFAKFSLNTWTNEK